jgi:hypothetical protein
MFRSSYDHLQKAQDEEITVIMIIQVVHQVETKFYMKILIKIKYVRKTRTLSV